MGRIGRRSRASIILFGLAESNAILRIPQECIWQQAAFDYLVILKGASSNDLGGQNFAYAE